jgi:hypothetical protein
VRQGAAFDVRLEDLNKDGRVDLLVTNHQATIEESAVFAYELPANIRTDPFVRHVLARDFETRQPGGNQGTPPRREDTCAAPCLTVSLGLASPGSALAFYPVVNETAGKVRTVRPASPRCAVTDCGVPVPAVDRCLGRRRATCVHHEAAVGVPDRLDLLARRADQRREHGRRHQCRSVLCSCPLYALQRMGHSDADACDRPQAT